MHKISAAVVLLFVVLSLVLTQPLALHLADAVEDRQDALLNVWITAWDGRQLLADPLHLFDANIFYPYPRTLAYSELLLGNALLALPVTAISGNPVLGYNLALLLSFVLSGLGTYLLVLKLDPLARCGSGRRHHFCLFSVPHDQPGPGPDSSPPSGCPLPCWPSTNCCAAPVRATSPPLSYSSGSRPSPPSTMAFCSPCTIAWTLRICDFGFVVARPRSHRSYYAPRIKYSLLAACCCAAAHPALCPALLSGPARTGL